MANVTKSFVEPVVTSKVSLRLDFKLARELNVFNIESAPGEKESATAASAATSKTSA